MSGHVCPCASNCFLHDAPVRDQFSSLGGGVLQVTCLVVIKVSRITVLDIVKKHSDIVTSHEEVVLMVNLGNRRRKKRNCDRTNQKRTRAAQWVHQTLVFASTGIGVVKVVVVWCALFFQLDGLL